MSSNRKDTQRQRRTTRNPSRLGRVAIPGQRRRRLRTQGPRAEAQPLVGRP